VLEFLSRPSSISNQVGTRSRIDVSCDFLVGLGERRTMDVWRTDLVVFSDNRWPLMRSPLCFPNPWLS
jgi:hypothetical protein